MSPLRADGLQERVSKRKGEKGRKEVDEPVVS